MKGGGSTDARLLIQETMSQSISLAITGLPQEYIRMQRGGVHWLACAGIEHADLLAAGVLAGADALEMAVMVSLGGSPAAVLGMLADEQGPAYIDHYQCRPAKVAAAVRGLPDDLPRITTARQALCVVQLPADALEAFGERFFADWCARLQDWARQGEHWLLLLCHGDASMLAPRLLPLNRSCSGIAQLHPHRGALQYLVHYWANAEGVVAHRDFRVETDGVQLQVVADGDAALHGALEQEGGDRFLYLAQAGVLEGAPPFSPAWHLFESWATLVAPAMQARAATVVLAIEDNADVDALARLLHRLRRERGNALKLVVREMAPCLRYADERLLLQSGVNLVVPANVPLARFLTLLETVQGQQWQGQLSADQERLIRLHRPPDIGGIVGAAQFKQVVGQLLGSDGSVVESTLLALQPVAGLRAEQTLQQLHTRRRGDLACVHGGQVWLFLFACRRDGMERALDNLFRLPWREIFDGYRRLAEYDLAAMDAGGDVATVSAPAPVVAASATPGEPATRDYPRPLRLGGQA